MHVTQQTVSLEWFQCRIGQGKHRRAQWGFIRKLHADVSDANPHFLQHWNGSRTSGEGRNRGRKLPSSYSSISFFSLPVLTRDPGPLLCMDHFLSFFTARMHWHLSVYLHGPQHSRETGVSLMNYLPSTAARHQSAITISATSTSGWEIRKWGTQRFVICPRSGSSQRNWGTECAWPEAAQQLHPQWSSTGVLAPVTLVKAAPDGCNSSFSGAKFFYGKLLEYFFSWDG